ncbi:MAG TPA: hypothetical protein VEY32_10300 [Flavisolibacter sp.]|nr:hypothetical protein [Flavisolibacter sp.]
MKTFIVVMLLGLFSFNNLSAQSRDIKQLIGKWEAVDSENQKGGLEVVDSSTIYLVYGTEKKRIASYKADFTKSPVWFDFVIKDESNTLQLKSLILFVNDDLIQWQVSEGDVRPANFSQTNGEMMYLRRKK